MTELAQKNPEIYKASQNGYFTAQKSLNCFLCIALDQIHEQENIKVKGVGRAVSILEKESALCRWMVADPEDPT